MFYLAPFALIALLGPGRGRRSCRGRGACVVAAAVVAGVLPVFIPYARFIDDERASRTRSCCCRGGGRRTT